MPATAANMLDYACYFFLQPRWGGCKVSHWCTRVPMGLKGLFCIFCLFSMIFLKSVDFFWGNTVSRSHPLRSKNAGSIAYYYYSVSTPASHHSSCVGPVCWRRRRRLPPRRPAKSFPADSLLWNPFTHGPTQQLFLLTYW